jgi:hypothetical protein
VRANWRRLTPRCNGAFSGGSLTHPFSLQILGGASHIGAETIFGGRQSRVSHGPPQSAKQFFSLARSEGLTAVKK